MRFVGRASGHVLWAQQARATACIERMAGRGGWLTQPRARSSLKLKARYILAVTWGPGPRDASPASLRPPAPAGNVADEKDPAKPDRSLVAVSALLAYFRLTHQARQAGIFCGLSGCGSVAVVTSEATATAPEARRPVWEQRRARSVSGHQGRRASGGVAERGSGTTAQ